MMFNINKNNKENLSEDIIIVDNFLDTVEFERLESFVIPQTNIATIPLYFSKKVNTTGSDANWSCYYNHLIYQNYEIFSDQFFNIIKNCFLGKMMNAYNLKTLIRCKLNHFHHTETLKEFDPHVDTDFPGRGAVFSLNTCDGFTRIGGKEKYDINDTKISSKTKKIDSVKNRMVFFNSANYHNSTSTTNSSARININFNFHY